MAQRLSVISQTRPKIISQGLVDLDEAARRMTKNTTFNQDEIYAMLRLYVREVLTALQAGETVKIDNLLIVSANMKVGGEVNVSVRGDRQAVAVLNNPVLWTATKVANHANLTKSADQLVDDWNLAHPDDPVAD
jgi:hypothetical protein